MKQIMFFVLCFFHAKDIVGPVMNDFPFDEFDGFGYRDLLSELRLGLAKRKERLCIVSSSVVTFQLFYSMMNYDKIPDYL